MPRRSNSNSSQKPEEQKPATEQAAEQQAEGTTEQAADQQAEGTTEQAAEQQDDGPHRYVVLKGFIDKNTQEDREPCDIIELTAERAEEINAKIPDAVAELAAE